MKIKASMVGLYLFVLGAVRLMFWCAIYGSQAVTVTFANNSSLQHTWDRYVGYLFIPAVQYILLGHVIFQIVSALFLVNGKKGPHFWPFFVHMFFELICFYVLNAHVTMLLCAASNPNMFAQGTSFGHFLFDLLVVFLVYIALATPFVMYYAGLRELVKVDYKEVCEKSGDKKKPTNETRPIFIV